MLSSPSLNTVHADTQSRASPSVALQPLLALNTNAADRHLSPATTKEDELLQSVDNSSAEAALALLALSPAISGGSGRMASLPPVSVSTPVLSAQTSSPTFVHPMPQILYGQDRPGSADAQREERYASPSYPFPASGPPIGTFYRSTSPYAPAPASNSIRLPSLPSASNSYSDDTRPSVPTASESKPLPTMYAQDTSMEFQQPSSTSTASPAPPPVPTPPRPRRAAVTIVGEGDERFQFRCVCELGYVEGDATIACDKCDVWQHMLCMGVDRDNVPEIYECEECRPRDIEADGLSSRSREGRVKFERDTRRAAAILAAAGGAVPPAGRTRRMSMTDVRPERAENGVPQVVAGSSGTPTVAVSTTTAVPNETPAPTRGRGRKAANSMGSSRSRRPLLHLTQLNAFASPALVGAGHTFALEEEEVPRMEAWAAEYLSLSKDHYSDCQLRESVQRIARAWPAPAAGSVEGAEDVVMDGSEAKEPSALSASASASPFPFPSPTTDMTPELSPYPPLVFTALPPLPNILIKPIPSSQPSTERADSTSYGRPPTYGLFAGDAPIAPDTLILEHRSVVRRRKEYVQDPTAQWARMGVPKAHVRMLPPPMSLVLDAREWGNEARFARAACHPNALLRPIIVGGELKFGLVSAREIGKREEICVAWDWEDGSVVHWLAEAPTGDEDEDDAELEEAQRRASEVVERFEASFVGCGCPKGKERDCAVAWLVRVAKGERGPIRDVGGKKGHGKGGGRKTKKPDLGPLVGVERGWDVKDGGEVAKWVRERAVRKETEEAEGTGDGEGGTTEEGEEEVSRSGTPLIPAHLKAPSVPSPLGSGPSVISELSPGTAAPRGKKRRFEQLSASPAPPSSSTSAPNKDAEEEDTPRARKRRMRDVQEKLIAEKVNESTGSVEPVSADAMDVDVPAPAPPVALVPSPAAHTPIPRLSPAFGEEELPPKAKEDVLMQDVPELQLKDSKAFPLVPASVDVQAKEDASIPVPASATSATALVSPDQPSAPSLQTSAVEEHPALTPVAAPEPTPVEPPAPAQPAIRKWSLKEWAAARKRGEVGTPVVAKASASPVASTGKALEPVKEEEGTSKDGETAVAGQESTSISAQPALEPAPTLLTERPEVDLSTVPVDSVAEVTAERKPSIEATPVTVADRVPANANPTPEVAIADLPKEAENEVEGLPDWASTARPPYRPAVTVERKPSPPSQSLSPKAGSTRDMLSPSVSINPYAYSPLSPRSPVRSASPPRTTTVLPAGRVDVAGTAASASPKSVDISQERRASTPREPVLKEEDVRMSAPQEEEDEPGAIEEGQISPERSPDPELAHKSDRDPYYDRRRDRELSEQRHLETPYREHAPPVYDSSRHFSPSPPRRNFPEDHRPSPEPYRERPRSPRNWAPRQQSPPRGPRSYPPLSPVFHAHPPPSPYTRPPPPGPRPYPPSAPRAIAEQNRYRPPEYEQARGPPIGPRALYGPPQYQARGGYPQYGRGGPGPQPPPQPRGYPPRGGWRGRGWR